MDKNVLTIGYLASNIETNVGRQIWTGIHDAARDNHVNFICIPGGRIRDNRDFMRQGNILYDLVTESPLDGLLSWVSSLSSHVSYEEIVRFHSTRYGPIPLIALGQKLPGRTALVVDSFKGMYDLVSHLIEVHRFKNIAHVLAMENHPYTQQRYRAYVKAHEDHGLPVREELVSHYGEWLKSAGHDAMELFFRERSLKPGRDVQCVTCTSDIQAFGVMDYCRENRILIPHDMALAGFNGVAEGAWSNPPLTTVTGPFYQQGYRGTELLLEEIRSGRVLDESIIMESEPVIRQSCGCRSEGIAAIPDGVCPEKKREKAPGAREEMIRELASLLGPQGDSGFDKALGIFVDDLEKDIFDGTTEVSLDSLYRLLQNHFSDKTDLFFPQSMTAYILKWMETLSLLEKGHALSLVFRLSALAGEHALRNRLNRQRRITEEKSLLNEMGQDVLTSRDLDELVQRLRNQLSHLGIGSCYLFSFRDQDNPLAESRLVYEYVDDSIHRLHREGDYFPPEEFIGRINRLIGNSPGSFVLEPLYHKTRQLGFVLFEVDSADGEKFRSLARFISHALDGVLLISQLQSTRNALEESYSQVERKVEQRTRELREEIRERKELEEKLRQSQKMEAVGRLAGGIAHDFNNLLTAINGSVEMMEDRDNRDQEDMYLDIIKDAGDRAADLVQQLLMFGRKQMVKPVVISVDDAIGGLQKILIRLIGEDILFSLDLSDRELLIEIDRSQFEQIIMNLVINARDALVRGGSITIGTGQMDIDGKGYAHIQVEDDGEGISRENLDKIFEPFFTTKELGKGTGMGLATVYGIVKQNQGEIRVESEPSRRTVFHVYLPLTDSGRKARESNVPVRRAKGKETVLYVDDEEAICSLMTKSLTASGYRVISAKNGRDALAMAENSSRRIDILITDVVMPHMGGRELEKEIRRKHPRIKVIFASGYTYDSIISSGKIGEDVNFIAKPFSPKTLLAYMRQILDNP